MLKLSIETCVMRDRFDDETAIKMINEAGFDAFDYSLYNVSKEKDMLDDDYVFKAIRLRELADEIGIVCNQAHAPFDFSYLDEFSISNKNYERIVRAIEVAAILGAKTIIIHSIKDNLPENVDFYEYNLKFYRSFIPYCEKFNICISVENLFKRHLETDEWIPVLGDPQEHMDFVKRLDSDWFNICVDVGHSAITGFVPEDVLGKMDESILKALHLHDNDLKNDSHLLPYTGSLNWDGIIASLKNIHYKEDITFEVMGFLESFNDENMIKGLKEAEQLGRKILNEF